MLGERLIDAGLVTADQLDLSLREQKRTGERIGETLINLGFVTQEQISAVLASQAGVNFIQLDNYLIEPAALKCVPESLSRRHKLIPILLEPPKLTVALANVFDVLAIDEVQRITGYVVDVVSATEEASLLLREVTASSPGLVEGWNALGLALLRQNRLDEADAVFSKVLSLSPRYAPGLLNAGLLRLAQGRIEEGAAFFSRAADLSPGALAPRVNLAVAQARLGNFGQAEETLLAAGRRFPGNPDVLYHLGTVYDRAGNRAKGTEAYTAFLAASAGSRPLMEDRVRARLRAWGDSP